MKKNVTAIRVNSTIYRDSKKAELAHAIVSMYSAYKKIQDEKEGITDRINHYCFVEVFDSIKAIKEIHNITKFVGLESFIMWEYLEMVTLDEAQ